MLESKKVQFCELPNSLLGYVLWWFVLNIVAIGCWEYEFDVFDEASYNCPFSISMASLMSHTTSVMVGLFALYGSVLRIAVSATFHMLSTL